MNELKELFECLDDVLHDYCTTYDPVEDRESVMATVSTQKMVALHEAYNRCKEHAHEMNHTFLPMDSAPMDGTMVLLINRSHKFPLIAEYESDEEYVVGWRSNFGMSGMDSDSFIGWFPIPKIPEELIKVKNESQA